MRRSLLILVLALLACWPPVAGAHDGGHTEPIEPVDPATAAFHMERRVEARIVDVAMDPIRGGATSGIVITVDNGVGQPAFDVRAVSLSLRRAGREQRAALRMRTTGTWRGTVPIASRGRWTVVVRLTIGSARVETVRGLLIAR